MANPLDELLRGLAPSDMGGQVSMPQAAPARQGPSKGEIILGILGDALAGAAGRGPAFGQMMAKRKDEEAQQAQWGLQRRSQLEDYEAKRQIDQRYDTPDVAPAVRDATAWQSMTPEQRQAYQQMKSMGAPDPDVFTTLPNGQFYAGPRSGLASALGGGNAAPRPVGKLTPINGGPTQPASGGFR